MFKIIVRHQGSIHDCTVFSQLDAIVLFNALTKTFLRVELWQGATLVQEYDNSATAIDAEHDEDYDEFGVNTKNTFNTAPSNG